MPRLSPYFLLLSLPLLLLPGCDSDSSTGTTYGSWRFTGYVVDGSTNQPLAGAKVSWSGTDGGARESLTDPDGRFSISDVPYGTQTFRFGARRVKGRDTVEYATRLVSVGVTTESSTMEGTLPEASRVVSLLPLDGSLRGELGLRKAGSTTMTPAAGVPLRLRYRDTTVVGIPASVFETITDSTGAFSFEGLPADTGLVLVADRLERSTARYGSVAVALPRLPSGRELALSRVELVEDTASDLEPPVVSSNVLGKDGLGLSGIPASLEPWYKLSARLDSSRLSVRVLAGSASFKVLPLLRKDTLRLRHATPFPTDSLVSVTISGIDLDGKAFELSLDGACRFRTRAAIYPVESNAWLSSRTYRSGFAPGDTFWVRFSEPLDPDVNRVQWAKTSTGRTLYASGSGANATSWVRSDTLFVRPDQRASVSDTDRMGFNVVVQAASGSVSAAVEIVGEVELKVPRLLWTNTRTVSGAVREDLRTRDSIVVVSDRPLSGVLQAVTSGGSTIPAGILPSSIALKGRDTIVVKPSFPMESGIAYAMAFDVVDAAGTIHRSVLAVSWKTLASIRVVSLDNRASDGYRRFRSLGDSLAVTFSEAVDTAKAFVVHMQDVNGLAVQVDPRWSSDRRTVVLRIRSPLPLADYRSVATATTDGDYAKAVATASFDLVSASGETVRGLAPSTEPVRIYTEEGLCVVGANFVANHASGYEVVSSESPVDSFPAHASLRVTFNRALDTASIRRTGISGIAVLEDGDGTDVSTIFGFADGGRTLVIDPVDTLVSESEYLLKLTGVPGLGIRSAGKVHSHGGTYTGGATGSYLLKSSFVVQ